MPTLLTNAPVPSSPDERRMRELLGAFPFLPGIVLAAIADASEAETVERLNLLTQAPNALYHAHPVTTGTAGVTVVYGLSPLGATVTYASPLARQLVAARDAQFHSASCTVLSPQQVTATIVAGYVATSVLGMPDAELHYAGSGPEPASLDLALPGGMGRADAALRIVTPTGERRDCFFFAAPTWDAMLPATERVRATWDILKAEGETERALLLGWGYDTIADYAFWEQVDLPTRDDLRAHLRTTHTPRVSVETSDTVVHTSPRRHARAVTEAVWAIDVPGNRAYLSLDALPRRRLEVFDGDAEIPQ